MATIQISNQTTSTCPGKMIRASSITGQAHDVDANAVALRGGQT